MANHGILSWFAGYLMREGGRGGKKKFTENIRRRGASAKVYHLHNSVMNLPLL